MTTTREALEARLCERWDLDDLAVYADLAQAAGERHGELIAIDLQLRREPGEALVERRQALLRDWLGPRLAVKLADLEFGMVERVTDDPEDIAILESPFGAFVRAASIRASGTLAQAFLERLARVRRPWLVRLELDVDTGHSSVAFPPTLIASLVRALPHLRELALGGDVSLDAFPHPELRRLRIDHPLAIRALCSGDAPMPALRSLELTGEARLPAWLVPEAVPALEHLDVSQLTTGDLEVCAALRDAPLPQLETLVLATVPSEAAEHALVEAIARMPRLVEVRIRGRRHDLTRLARSSPVIRVPGSPWPSALAGRRIAITVPPGTRVEPAAPGWELAPRGSGEPAGEPPPPVRPPPPPAGWFVVDAATIAPWLDLGELPDAARGTWQALIAALVEVVETGAPRTFPIAALVDAFAHGVPPEWEAVAAAMRYWAPESARVATLANP